PSSAALARRLAAELTPYCGFAGVPIGSTRSEGLRNPPTPLASRAGMNPRTGSKSCLPTIEPLMLLGLVSAAVPPGTAGTEYWVDRSAAVAPSTPNPRYPGSPASPPHRSEPSGGGLGSTVVTQRAVSGAIGLL